MQLQLEYFSSGNAMAMAMACRKEAAGNRGGKGLEENLVG